MQMGVRIMGSLKHDSIIRLRWAMSTLFVSLVGNLVGERITVHRG